MSREPRACYRPPYMATTSILAADADPLQRQLLDMLLGLGTFDVAVVASGAEALAHLRGHTPDAAVLAMDLSDVAGSVICRKMKSVKRLAHVRVVLVAPEPEPGSTVSEGLRREAREAGADLLLQKPLGDKNLRERVQRLLEAPARTLGAGAAGGNDVLDGALFPGGDPNALTPMLGSGTPAASELGGLRAEVARLRHENETLKARLAKVKERNRVLQAELDEARKPRGLFGRRT